MEHKLIVSSSPHIHAKESVSGIMSDVIIALLPAAFMGVYYFGISAMMVILTAIASCMLFEYFYEKAMKKRVTVGDMSAVVTGLLIGLNMPPAIPLWMVVVGSGFAIIIVKQLYGGLGKNFLNPALAARCFMLVAWADVMSSGFREPMVNAISGATPLAILNGTSGGAVPKVIETFLGTTAGSIGETSALALLIGGVYLLVRRVISFRIPVIFVGVFVVLTALFGKNPLGLETLDYTLLHMFSGGLMLAAIFMATDYTTTPTTKKGQIIFAFGCGLMTFLVRNFGGYPEGASFAILIMNILTPLIDRFTMPKKFGAVKKAKN